MSYQNTMDSYLIFETVLGHLLSPDQGHYELLSQKSCDMARHSVYQMAEQNPVLFYLLHTALSTAQTALENIPPDDLAVLNTLMESYPQGVTPLAVLSQHCGEKILISLISFYHAPLPKDFLTKHFAHIYCLISKKPVKHLFHE